MPIELAGITYLYTTNPMKYVRSPQYLRPIESWDVWLQFSVTVSRISWTEHVTNEEVFDMTNTKPTLLDRGDWLSMVTSYGKEGGITSDLMIDR